MKPQFETPILLLVFNRPDLTAQIFDIIRHIRPKQLFVAADGPRSSRPDDQTKCDAVRRISTGVDWPCDVKTLFREVNLGCRVAVSEGISWFFEHVSAGIILEDDCMPSQSFFPYCQELLKLYADDERIVHINGNNFNSTEYLATGYSYHFTYFPQVWGWATWRRAWRRYDPDMKLYEQFNDNSFFLHAGVSKEDFKVLQQKWNNIKTKRIDTWDYQWHFINLLEGTFSISPTLNLISNVGFGKEATHTFDENSDRQNIQRSEFDAKLVHPPCVFIDAKLNSFYKRMMIRETKWRRLYRKIAKTIKISV